MLVHCLEPVLYLALPPPRGLEKLMNLLTCLLLVLTLVLLFTVRAWQSIQFIPLPAPSAELFVGFICTSCLPESVVAVPPVCFTPWHPEQSTGRFVFQVTGL